MNAPVAVARPVGTAHVPTWLLMFAGAVVAVFVATCVGDPNPGALAVFAAVTGVTAAFAAMTAPYAGYLALVGSTVFLLAVALPGGKSVNPFDLLLPSVLVGTMAGSARRTVRAERERSETGPAHEAIRTRHRELVRSAVVYLSVAALSLGVTLAMGLPAGALESGMSLFRGVEGLLIFPLVIVWVRDLRSLRHTVYSMLAAWSACAVVNALAIGSGGTVKRASMVWFVNERPWSMGSPNELGTSVLMAWVLIIALHRLRPRKLDWLVLLGLSVLLFATQSRGSLIAWLIFVVFSLGRIGWRVVVGALAALSFVLLALPGQLAERLLHSAFFEKGSFEVFSAMIRVFGWQAAVAVFRDHPLFGVGYMGFRHIGDRYNPLGLVMAGTENMFLEVATGMGVVGLVVFGVVIVRLYRLGSSVRRVTPSGTLGHQLAALHGPFITGLLSVAMTGTLWVGMLGLAQLALWCALLIRAGHVALTDGR
jgi:hypothetical protein